MTNKIDKFFGAYRFLSNFWLSPLKYEGRVYWTAEHAYQAAKTLDEKEKRQFVGHKLMPAEAKRAGRFVHLRSDWDEIKVSVMETILREKFKNHAMALKLLATNDLYLEEGNYWGDRFWGVYMGQGLNHLGKILMKLRQELKEESEELKK